MRNLPVLRAHHGMCLQYFEGKGYCNDFTAHMGKILKQMDNNPLLIVINESDIICSHCPNLVEGSCNTYELVRNYDNKVLSLCGLPSGTVIRWNDFRNLVKENILKKNRRKEICSNCSWNDICSLKERETFL